VRTHESDVTRARDRLRHLDEKRVAATKQRDELETSIVAYDAERTGYEAQLRGVDEGLHEEEALALEEHERLDELRQGERASEDEAQQQRRRLSQATSVVAASEATLATFARRMTEIGQRRVRLEDELGRLAFEREELSRKRDDMRGQVTELGELKAHATEERARLEGELRALREDAVGRDKAVDQAKNELHQRRSRLRALEELHQKLEGVGTGVRNLLGTKDASLGGLFADRVEAPEHLTQAFAGLLGAELQAVVVSEPTRALALLDDLRRSKKGRATVVAARPRYVAGARAPLPTLEGELSSGVVCFLVDELRYEPEDEALVRALVGDAVVVERAEVALALRAAGATHTLVTREGTVLHADGRIAGGMGDEVAAHMVEQKREIRELHDRVAEASQRVSVLLDEQTSLRQRLADATAGLERARADAHRAEIELLAADKDEKRAEERLAHAERREGEVRRELEELEASLETAREEEAAAREKVDVGIAEQDRAHAALEHAEMVAADWRERVMGQQSVVTERKVGLAKIKERARSLRDTVERLARSCEELRARIVKLDDEREHAARDAGKAAAVIWLGRERLSGALFEARRAEGELRVAREGLDAARAELGERELALRGLRAEASEATTAAQKHEMSLEKLRLARESLEGGVRERFRGLELARVVGDFHKRPPVDAAHRARIQELGELIERMGPVNVDAVREHKEAQERFSYYDGQKKDLEKALDDLDKAIAQMNRESKRLFRATFDGVNQNFKTLFPTMFRGGQAELRLTNPDDLLETGIEILAQPPGKKLGTIELMSGGEKALTAVALIFAIFQFKPSPFCILDEVDAPLDEANVARYNDGIRRMTDRSQFILITHIKRTMQSVDVLYGVTMQEAGVSKLVSVRVNESGRVDRSPAGSAQAAAVA
jgi:chromosome segregation protein